MSQRGPRPVDPRHDLMVRAVLAPGEAGRRAYERWRVGVDVQRLDQASTTLLVPLSHRWGGEADDEVAAQVTKVARMTWLRGQLLTTWTAPALADLRAHGIELVLTKGAAVLHHTELDHRARPMDDVDVLVPFPDVAAATHRLATLGFQSELAPLLASRPRLARRSLHGVVFRDARGARVDLHWHLLATRLHPRADEAAWTAAVPSHWGDVPVRVTSREDTLVHVVAHGAGFMQHPALRWATDAAALLRGGDVDWDVVAARTAALRLGGVVGAGLAYLAEVAPDLGVPAEVLATLTGQPRSVVERALAVVERGPGPVALAAADWRRDLDQAVPPGRRPALRDLAAVVAAERRALRAPSTARPVPLGKRVSGRLRPDGGGATHLLAGWHYPEPHGTWTARRRARLSVRLTAPYDGPLVLVATVLPFLSPARPLLRVHLRVDGERAGTWTFRGTTLELTRRRLRVPARADRDAVEVLLDVRDPLTGYENGTYGDERALGLALHRFVVRPA